MKNNKIGFSLVDISIEEFAVVDDNFPTDKDKNIEISFGVNTKLNRHSRLIGMFVKCIFQCGGEVFLVGEVGCHFMISTESWNQFMNDDGSITIKKGFLINLF